MLLRRRRLLQMQYAPTAFRLLRTCSASTATPTPPPPTITRIGDVQVSVHPGTAPHLIPRGLLLPGTIGHGAVSCPEVLGHLEWMARKWTLGADMMLLGHNSELRRQVALLFAEVCDMEVEYLRLTRDTTEADLKQRRELSVSVSSIPTLGADPTAPTAATAATSALEPSVLGGSSSVSFHDQPPVRAALRGRLLILDGLDQVTTMPPCLN